MNDFDDDDDFTPHVNSDEMNKNIDNYIRRNQSEDEDEDFSNPMAPLAQIERQKRALKKERPNANLIIRRAIRDRNKI
jgi:type I restriction-modification system DNA methylase subunit